MLKRGLSPMHPGELLKDQCLAPLGLTVTEAARGLGVSRNALSAIINERAGVSPEMAIKLSEAFGTSAEVWINLQKRYDLYKAQKTVSREGITRFHERTPA